MRVGANVHYLPADGLRPGECRAALVVRRNPDESVNLALFRDGGDGAGPTVLDGSQSIESLQSIERGTVSGTWHLPQDCA